MRITTLAVAFGAALLLSLHGASPSFAKGHDNGFGGGRTGIGAGDLPAGAVASGVRNDGGMGSSTSYGSTVRDQAQSGMRDNSTEAQTKDGSHPSNTDLAK